MSVGHKLSLKQFKAQSGQYVGENHDGSFVTVRDRVITQGAIRPINFEGPSKVKTNKKYSSCLDSRSYCVGNCGGGNYDDSRSV